MNDLHQKVIAQRLERVLIAFFVLATLFLLVVYVAAPSIYTQTLLFEPSTTDRYPLSATLFLVGILVFIAVLIVGVVHHWRWLFWLLLVAFGFMVEPIFDASNRLAGGDACKEYCYRHDCRPQTSRVLLLRQPPQPSVLPLRAKQFYPGVPL